jgi:hypothetical protein
MMGRVLKMPAVDKLRLWHLIFYFVITLQTKTYSFTFSAQSPMNQMKQLRPSHTNERHRISLCVCFASSLPQDSVTEDLKHDIAELRELAANRLDALLEQMEDLKKKNKLYEEREKEESRTQQSSNSVAVHSNIRTSSSETSKPFEELKVSLSSMEHRPSTSTELNLLDETSWKIVYNIGREKGTWMPKEWAASGDRLLFQCTVHFTKDELMNDELRDAFFQGHADTKQLIVKNAFIIPRGVGDNSVGRRPLPVQPTGAYKVCRSQGPYGTNVVRLFIELTDDVIVPDHKSDVNCPSGRIYATCGYFPIQSQHDPSISSIREKTQEQYNAALREYEQKQFQLESDNGSILNINHFNLIKDSWDAKKNVDHLALTLREARQREPEKAQLRLNVAQTVGLTREGGVCCKVHKGLALEYHILGQVEVGCIDDS